MSTNAGGIRLSSPTEDDDGDGKGLASDAVADASSRDSVTRASCVHDNDDMEQMYEEEDKRPLGVAVLEIVLHFVSFA